MCGLCTHIADIRMKAIFWIRIQGFWFISSGSNMIIYFYTHLFSRIAIKALKMQKSRNDSLEIDPNG